MKRFASIIVSIIYINCFSQAITVNTSNYTVPQLVSNVLINSNCVSTSNITWRTGTNFGSSNGIGYFQNTNPNFPLQSGVILSTGDVSNAVGPNLTMLEDGSASWTGDSDLENILAHSGISMISANATVLEFDFTPFSSHFSFNFVFASEEYGNFQCNFSDAFAFLLTNMNTGVTTNLAVVPNTNTPISVVTIRDYLYNSSCPSVNAQYFGSFNGGGGSAAAASATNFNGQTQLLTASSTLEPNTPYHIKLVIADRGDYKSDSAIFIASDSFNIGQEVLGADLTIANNTALCNGMSYTLQTGLDSVNYTFVWKRNNVVIPNVFGSSLNITQSGVYSVTYTSVNCQPITDYITVEYYPQMSVTNPKNIYKCNTGSDAYTYDLAINTPIVLTGLPPQSQVNYFATLSDANDNINPISSSYSSPGNQTIYVRVKNGTTNCVVVKSFILVAASPIIDTQPQNLIKCETTNGSNTANFNLNSQTQIIKGNQPYVSQFSVTYYLTQNDANNGLNAITNPQNYVSGNKTIYARIQANYDSGCFALTSFNLIVNPTPQVVKLENVIACDSYTLPLLTSGSYFTGNNGTGTQLFAGNVIDSTKTIYIFNQPSGPGTCSASSSFTVTIINPEILAPSNVISCGSYILPALSYGNYYTGTSASGTQISSGTVITSTQTLYYYYKTPKAPFCIINTSFTITITPIISIGNKPDVFACDAYTLPLLAVGDYYTGPNGTGEQIPAGTILTSSQVIYVFTTTGGALPCTDNKSFNVYIGLNAPEDISQCNGYTLPQLQIGNYFTGPAGTGLQLAAGAMINQTTTLYVFVPTNGPNCTDNVFFNINISQPNIDIIPNQNVCGEYTLPHLTTGNYFTGPNGTGAMLNSGSVITSTKKIYIYAQSSSTCFNQNSFTIIVNQLPQIDSRDDIDICNSYVLTPLTHGNYYTGPNGSGIMLTAGSIITSSQTIYIYSVSNAETGCSLQNSFNINIFSIEADHPADVTACDTYILQQLTIGEYYTQPGGQHGNGTLLHAGQVISNTITLYIYTESGGRVNCSDENIFKITINSTPIVSHFDTISSCNSYSLPLLTVGDYFTGPNGTGNMLNAGAIITNSQRIYIYAQTNTYPNCSDESSFLITIFNVDEIPNTTICESYSLPILNIGKYYTGSNGTGTLLSAGTIITSSKTLYIYAESPFTPTCIDESVFTITILPSPIVNIVPVNFTTICDEDGTNDGVTTFVLSNLTSVVLGSQPANEFSVSYYENLTDAVSGNNPITNTTLSHVFVRVNNVLVPNCYDIRPISIMVNKLPEPKPSNGFVCIDSKTGVFMNPYTIYSGLSTTSHTFLWKNELGVTVGANSFYTATQPGKYSVTATNLLTGCSSVPTFVTVNVSESAVVSYTVNEYFANQQSITVIATGNGGNYEYQLDSGLFQDSPIFENVLSGFHIITVRDKNGCGLTTIRALVINYPRFFTPNGDGYNDTWNIKDLAFQKNSIIYIYDRYGKLLKQIKPSDEGWDGTLYGNLMPSDDYWFTVTYSDEKQITQEFKAHFAMKR